MEAEVSEYVLQYLKALDFHMTYQALQEELHAKTLATKRTNQQTEPRLLALFKAGGAKSKREGVLRKQLKEHSRKYKQVLQAGRQIFSITISLLQMLHSMKEVSSSQSLLQSMENLKIQLGRHHKTIINQGNPQGAQLISDQVIISHKQNLDKYFREGNLQKQVEVFLSLRVNALQIAPELRRSLVNELVRKDILRIQEEGFGFVLEILQNPNRALRHAVTSLLSVIASTLRGVDYLLQGTNSAIFCKIIGIVKSQENGNITQRFGLAILQKASMKSSVVQACLENEMIQWVLVLLKRSFLTEINPFCLDFGSALLASILHSRTAVRFLAQRMDFVRHIVESILKMCREKMQVSLLMHLLICLNYLHRDEFKTLLAEMKFKERVSEFCQYYGQKWSSLSDASEVDKKTVLDLCNHIFHGKPRDEDEEAKIAEYENQHNELIFECFQDEVHS